MSQADLDNLRSQVSVAVVWHQRSHVLGKDPKKTTLRFGLKDCFVQTEGEDWEINPDVIYSGTTVITNGQYYDNLISMGPLRQGFSAGWSAKMKETTQTITIAKTSDLEYIGYPGFDWDDILQLRDDFYEADSVVGTMGIFVFKTGTAIDADGDLVFIGDIQGDSFEFQEGVLKLTVKDALARFNVPVLKTVTERIYGTRTELAKSTPLPLIFGHFEAMYDHSTLGYSSYQFIELIPAGKIRASGGDFVGELALCQPGSNKSIIYTGTITDNLIYHWFGGTLTSVHPVLSSQANIDGMVEINNTDKVYPIGGSPIGLDDFDGGHTWYMICHDIAGAKTAVGALPMTFPYAIWEEILTHNVGVPSASIGTRAYPSGGGRRARKVIKDQIKLFPLLDDLLEMYGYVTIVVNGKFEFVGTPLHDDRSIDHVIFPRDIVSVGGKTTLVINSDPGKDWLSKDVAHGVYYNSNNGFTPSETEQAEIQLRIAVRPQPPGLVASAPLFDGSYFNGLKSSASPNTVEWQTSGWLYDDGAQLDAFALVLDQEDYMHGETTGLRGGKVVISKRFVGTKNPLGQIIQIKKSNYSDDVLMNALVYDISTDFEKLQTTLLFEEVQSAKIVIGPL